jgi:subtilisin-like proprotein convertase family protein
MRWAGIDLGAAANSGTNAPVARTFNPEGPVLMSAFDGEDASGQWRLTIIDDTATNTGFLNGWSLHFVF